MPELAIEVMDKAHCKSEMEPSNEYDHSSLETPFDGLSALWYILFSATWNIDLSIPASW